MAGKGRFLFIIPRGSGYRALVRASDFSDYPEGTTFTLDHGLGLPLSTMSTDDLFKVKAQIATELESRMDLDEVTEANLEKLKATIKVASSETIAQLLRKTLDRLDVVGADEKRAKTRQQILEDELRHRMIQDGVSDMKFNGLIQATYKQETVYSVGEEGWDTVYSGIVADTLEAQLENRDERNLIIDRVNIREEVDDLTTMAAGAIQDRIDVLRGRLRREKDINNEDISDRLALLDDLEAELNEMEVDASNVRRGLVNNVSKAIVENIRDGIVNIDAFSIIQKRLTSTTLNELVKQGEELPKGIESQEIRKLKIKRTK